MATKVESSELENKVATAVAEATSELPDTQGNEPKPEPKEDENAKLDEQAELFVRRVVDGLTKNLSDLLNPPKKERKKEEPEVKKEAKSKPKSFMTFFGG